METGEERSLCLSKVVSADAIDVVCVQKGSLIFFLIKKYFGPSKL